MVPQEKNCFKLRRGREKRIIVVLQQVSGPRVLVVAKCFGLLLAAGRNVRQSDMHLLDMQVGSAAIPPASDGVKDSGQSVCLPRLIESKTAEHCL